MRKDINFDFSECSSMTEGYTPSDITALCSAAASIPVQERNIAIRKAQNKLKILSDKNKEKDKDKEKEKELERNKMMEKKVDVLNVSQTPGISQIGGDDVSSTIPLRPLKVKVSHREKE